MHSWTRLATVLLACLTALVLSSPVRTTWAQSILKIGGNEGPRMWRCGSDILLLQELRRLNAEVSDPTGEPITVPVDRLAQRRIDTALDYIRAESWPESIKLLQLVIEAREDTLLEVHSKDDKDQPVVRWISARGEAQRLIGSLPAPGLELYQLTYGQLAADRLKDAKIRNDPHQLGEIVQRHLYTKAGAEALALLGDQHLDRGRPALAADCYQRLLRREKNRVPPLTLVHAVVAFRQTGDRTHEELAWQRLVAQEPNGVRLGKQLVSLEQLRKEVDRIQAGTAKAADWPMFRGNPTRSSQASGGIPYLEPRWQTSTLEHADAKRVVDQAVKYHNQVDEPLLPTFFPVSAGNKVMFRAFDGIRAIDLKTGKEAWRSAMPLSYEGVLSNAGKKVQIEQWMRMYQANSMSGRELRGFAPPPAPPLVPGGGPPGGFPTSAWAGMLLFNNCVQGTLSTDRRYVYAVEDLPLPPHPDMIQEMLAGNPRHFGPLKDALYHNRLRAIDVETGKLTWEVGGRGKGELDESYFLGPPLPLAGKLYVLTERNGDLRLICLDAERGDVVWTQTLATFRDKILLDARRRIQATSMSYADGILVCSTNSGLVIGFEVLTRSLLWVHPYRGRGGPQDEVAPGFLPLTMLLSSWRTSAPLIHNGKVVFTAPDDGSIHCINLRDGTPVWKSNRGEEDLYLAAAHKDKVLIVGRQLCRAVGMADGKQVWQLETGLPSGQGVASGNVYFLPVRKPGVRAIDMDQGTIVASTEARTGDVPGNLLFHDGELISQNVNQLAGYPQLKVKLAQINERIARDPRDPVGLTERGALRIDQGELPTAVTDLRAALANRPPPEVLSRARTKLYEALTQWLQRDFRAAEQFLEEYRDLCQVPFPESAPAEHRVRARDEQERRLTTYHALVGRGREQQKRLPEALQAYRHLYDLARSGQPLTALDDASVKARPDVWVQGRITTLMTQATAEQRRTIEEQLAREGKDLRSGDDLFALERFVALYGSACDAGLEAKLELAERLSADRDRGRFLEAELYLMQLREQRRNPALAVRAVEALAQLSARKGLMENAGQYYRTLARDFARVVVRDGKTGADIFDDLAADKRYQGSFQEATPAWVPGRLRAFVHPVDVPLKQNHLYFQCDVELPPSLRPYRLALDLGGSRLKLLERATGKEVWDHRLALGNFANPLRELAQQQQPVPYRQVGHLAIVHLGFMTCGVDLIERRILWQRKLVDESLPPEQVSINFDPVSGWQLVEFGRNTMAGKLELANPSVICIQMTRGLMGLDPVTGEVLWTRTDSVGEQSLLGSQDHIYLLQFSSGNARALRARDGVAVEVPRIPDGWTDHQYPGGSQVLLSHRSANNLHVLLHDVHTGKQVWLREFPDNSRVVVSPDPKLTAVVEPEGKVTVLEVASQKVLLQGKIDPNHIKNLQAAHLLHDRNRFYLALDCPPDPNAPSAVRGAPNFLGSRPGIPVNGMLYAFDRATGNLAWANSLPNQFIVHDHFEDVPLLICTAWIQQQTGQGRLIASTRTFDKKTGKLLYSKETVDTGRGDQPQALPQFHTLQLDPIAGTIDLIGTRMKIRHENVGKE